MSGVLLLMTGPVENLPSAVLAEASQSSVTVLDLHGTGSGDDIPAQWTKIAAEELVDAACVRRRFLEFLEVWPSICAGAGRSFDALFTVEPRYSIWWTSVGADRQATHGIFKYFRSAALVDRAIERLVPDIVWLSTSDRRLAAVVASRAARSGIGVRRVSDDQPVDAGHDPDLGWMLRSARRAVTAPFGALAESSRCRAATRASSLFKPSGRRVVVFASRFPRYLEIRRGRFAPSNWKEICAALKEVEPGVEHAFLPWTVRHVSDLDDRGQTAREGVEALRGLHAPLIIRERFFPLRGHVTRLVRHLSAIWRFHRLARTASFRRSFEFAGADMSPVILRDLQDAIAGMTAWSLRRAQFACALRRAGNVRAVVLSEELYRPSMPLLAAAAGLGIPTVGVQHGTIMPAHLIYTPPRGHIHHAPVPDYFAAYGDYAKTTLSEYGAYPADRVWTAGAARLDPLVNSLEERSVARAKLGLPADRKIVVLATQTFPWFASAIRAVLECMAETPDAILCIRKHPSSRAMSIESIQAMALELGATNVRGSAGDIGLLLAACDVWISASSTTILEATLAGRPTICVNFSNEPDGYPYVEDGASLPARTASELRASLDRALRPADPGGGQSTRAAFLHKHAGPTAVGQAAATFAQRLRTLVAER